jgi:hypothetical protein
MFNEKLVPTFERMSCHLFGHIVRHRVTQCSQAIEKLEQSTEGIALKS